MIGTARRVVLQRSRICDQDSRSRVCAPGSRIQVPGSRLLDPGSCIQDPGTRTARWTLCCSLSQDFMRTCQRPTWKSVCSRLVPLHGVMIVFTSVQFHGGTGTARHARRVLTRHVLSWHGTARLDRHGHASLRRGLPRFGRCILNRHSRAARSEPARCDRHGTARGASSAIQDL